MRKILAILAVFAVAGCCNITIEPTKPFEGHYMTVEDFKSGTSDIKLDANESIWVLSNTTLKRLLRNIGK